MGGIQVSERALAGLREGIREERERVALLETTPPNELAAALRQELDGACNAISDDEWDQRPAFVIDLLDRRLAERGVAAAVELTKAGHAAHLLRSFPGVLAVLRRFDLAWHERNLQVLQSFLYQSLDAGGRVLP